MFQFSDDFDDAALEDVLSISTCQSVNESTASNTNSSCHETSIADSVQNSNISLEDFDEDDLILSAFESDTSVTETKTPTCSFLQKCNPIRPDTIHTSQIPHSSKDSSPVVEKHNSPFSHPSPSLPKYPKIEYQYVRKFPGPAGLILKKSKEHSVVSGDKLVPSKSVQIEAQQIGDSLFSHNPSWQALLTDVNSESNKLLQRVNDFTISNIRRLNLVKDISQKIPIFAAVISNLNSSVGDPSVILKDPSGEIGGTLHKDLWDEYNHLLVTGSTLLLRQVSVWRLINSRKLRLNITTNNIVRIYTPPCDDKPSIITNVRTISESDFSEEIKTDRSITKSTYSPSSSITPAKDPYSNAKPRSNTDLLNLINSNLDSSRVSSSPKIASPKKCVPDLNSNSVAISDSAVELVPLESSPHKKSCDDKASLIFNELEGLDADSIFDDF